MNDHVSMPVLMVACGTEPGVRVCQRHLMLAQCMQKWSTLHTSLLAVVAAYRLK